MTELGQWIVNMWKAMAELPSEKEVVEEIWFPQIGGNLCSIDWGHDDSWSSDDVCIAYEEGLYDLRRAYERFPALEQR